MTLISTMVRGGLRTARAGLLFVLFAALLAGCRSVEVTPTDPQMPVPLVVPAPTKVGVYYSEDFRKAEHKEERWDSKWTIHLGASHEQLIGKLLQMAFRDVVPVTDPKAVATDSGIKAILEPAIDQYSFVTPEDTAGGYYAVTIKYRLSIYAPDGQLADTLAFTGYGNAYGGRASKTMAKATQAAMRDAAAKFLVQFPEQPVAKKLNAGETLVAAKPPSTGDGAGGASSITEIVAVAIIDKEEPAASGEPGSATVPAGNLSFPAIGADPSKAGTTAAPDVTAKDPAAVPATPSDPKADPKTEPTKEPVKDPAPAPSKDPAVSDPKKAPESPKQTGAVDEKSKNTVSAPVAPAAVATP